MSFLTFLLCSMIFEAKPFVSVVVDNNTQTQQHYVKVFDLGLDAKSNTITNNMVLEANILTKNDIYKWDVVNQISKNDMITTTNKSREWINWQSNHAKLDVESSENDSWNTMNANNHNHIQSNLPFHLLKGLLCFFLMFFLCWFDIASNLCCLFWCMDAVEAKFARTVDVLLDLYEQQNSSFLSCFILCFFFFFFFVCCDVAQKNWRGTNESKQLEISSFLWFFDF